MPASSIRMLSMSDLRGSQWVAADIVTRPMQSKVFADQTTPHRATYLPPRPRSTEDAHQARIQDHFTTRPNTHMEQSDIEASTNFSKVSPLPISGAGSGEDCLVFTLRTGVEVCSSPSTSIWKFGTEPSHPQNAWIIMAWHRDTQVSRTWSSNLRPCTHRSEGSDSRLAIRAILSTAGPRLSPSSPIITGGYYVTYVEYRGAKNNTIHDVIHSLRRLGAPIYDFDPETYHATKKSQEGSIDRSWPTAFFSTPK
ncbi:hypothetical protein CGCF413_v015472 [Colletotrichum fructicola]|nr:hypothetical protein CGCF413_v015472 [Colletotrichum fructicola]